MAPYNPPINLSYAELDISKYDNRMILCMIGKGGKGFYGLTRKLKISYLWWNQERRVIELWGTDFHLSRNDGAVNRLREICDNFDKNFVVIIPNDN